VTIRSIDHINIKTDKLEETKDFFVQVLGLAVGERPDFGFPGYWLYADGAAIVHLVGTETPAGHAASQALDHFAFATDDYAGLVAQQRNNVPFTRLDAPDGGRKQVFFRDPNNVTIEATCTLNASGT